MEPLSPRAVNIQTKPRPPLKAYVNPVKTQAAPKVKDPVPKPPPVVVQPPISQGSLSDKYKIGNHLGKGGFAVCYEGELQCRKYNTQDRIYALKTVPAHMNNKKMEEKFRTELQIHAKLHHPNIVEFHRAFTYKENTYLVLELCRSGSVMDLVKKRGCLSLPEVRRITVQLCGAVKYMHSRNVIHRDLKMGNLFLDHDMNLKLGDFGLAAVLVNKGEYEGVYDKKFSRRTTICGTPNYIAPEILEKSKGGHDHKVDIWAIGVILFAMITGFPPFQATSQDEIYRKAKTVDYDWPDSGSNTRRCHNDIPWEAKDLVACLLKVDAETRPNPDEIIGQSFFSMHGGNAMPLTLDPSCRRQKPVWLLDEAPRGDVMDRLTPRLELHILARQCGVGHLKGDIEPYKVVGENVDISLYKECVAEEKAETSPVVPLPMDMVYTSAISLKTWPNHRSPSPESAHPAQTVSSRNDGIPRRLSVEDISQQQQQQVSQPPNNLQPRRAPVPSHAATLRAAHVGSMPTRGLPRTISGVGQLQDSMKNLDLQSHSRRIPTRRLLNELPVRPNASIPGSGTLQTAVAPRQSSRITRSAATKASAPQPNAVAPTSELEVFESDKKGRERSAKTEARIAATVQEEIEEAILGQKGSRRQKRSQPTKTTSDKPRNSVLISPDEVAETLVGTTPEDVCYNLRRLSDEIKGNLDCPRHNEKNLAVLLATGKRSAKDRPVIVKWVDYSHRFGIGYILENGTVGSVLRGDNGVPTTCLAVAGAEVHLRKRKSPSYIDKTQILSKDGAPVAFFEDCGDEGLRRVLVPSRNYHMKGSRGTSEEFRQAINDYDREKRERLCIWDKFGRYMTQSLGKSDGPDPHACSSDKETLSSKIEPIGPFIRFYQRLGNVGVWGFGDGSFQINFPDHTKVVVSHDGTWVDFYHLSVQAAQTLKRGEILEAASLVERSVLRYPTSVMLSGSYRGHDFQRLITENQLPEKLAFFKDVVEAWHDAGGLGCMGAKNEVRWEGMSEKGGKLVWVTVGAHGGDGRKYERRHDDYGKFKVERGIREYSTGIGIGYTALGSGSGFKWNLAS